MKRIALAVAAVLAAPLALQALTWPVGGDPYTTDTLRRVLSLPVDAPVAVAHEPHYTHQSVEMETTADDGLVVHGLYTHTAARTQAPVLILIHEGGRARSEFDSFAPFLLDSGISTLAIDLRGYGRSTAFADGTQIHAADFEKDRDADVYTKMDKDVTAAIAWLKSTGRVDPQGIFLYGNVLGASVAGKALGPNARDLRGVVMVTPQFEYRGIELIKELRSVQGIPLLVLAGPEDAGNSTILTRISELNPNVVGRQVDGKGAGSSLMTSETLRRHILAFLHDNGQPRP